MTDHTPLDDANSTIRRLLHQRKCLREERDRAFEEGALSMRERAAQQLEYTPPIDSPPEHAALKAAYADAIRALPLLPDDGEPKKSGRVEWLEIDGKQVHPKPATVHAATPEGITPCGEGTRDVTTSGLIPEITCVGCLQELAMEKGEQLIEMRAEHLDVKLDGTRRRLAALEQQYTDLAALVHGHGEDLAGVAERLNRANDVARELGEALKEHIQVNIDAATVDPVDALSGLAKTLSRRRFTAGDDG